MSPGLSDVHSRERLFHDAWATGTPLADIRVRECFEAPAAVENHFILGQMGSLSGMRILDVGAGLGESSVCFALRGAKVVTVDISPEMVAKARELGRFHGVELDGRVAAGEKLPVSGNEFDIVYIANTIHHINGREALFSEIRRVLKPGGRFYSIDPIAYNPVVNIYRRMANEVRTADEAPLHRSDFLLARRYFPDTRCRMFWIATLALFIKYYLVDRVHPNQDRYWKRILAETGSALWWWRPLLLLDSLLTRVAGLRWLSWNVVMWGSKAVTTQGLRK